MDQEMKAIFFLSFSEELLIEAFSMLTKAEHYDPGVTPSKVKEWWDKGLSSRDFKLEILRRLKK